MNIRIIASGVLGAVVLASSALAQTPDVATADFAIVKEFLPTAPAIASAREKAAQRRDARSSAPQKTMNDVLAEFDRLAPFATENKRKELWSTYLTARVDYRSSLELATWDYRLNVAEIDNTVAPQAISRIQSAAEKLRLPLVLDAGQLLFSGPVDITEQVLRNAPEMVLTASFPDNIQRRGVIAIDGKALVRASEGYAELENRLLTTRERLHQRALRKRQQASDAAEEAARFPGLTERDRLLQQSSIRVIEIDALKAETDVSHLVAAAREDGEAAILRQLLPPLAVYADANDIALVIDVEHAVAIAPAKDLTTDVIAGRPNRQTWGPRIAHVHAALLLASCLVPGSDGLDF